MKGIYSIFGATGFNDELREINDYYATDPIAVELLLEREQFKKTILEPCCGEGHISKVLENHGYRVLSSDLIDRGYGKGGIDFLSIKYNEVDLITNPPYKYSTQFVKHALNISKTGTKIAMLLKIQFLEGVERKKMFMESPPKTVYVFSKRIKCGKNGNFDNGAGTICFCWFIWEKGFNGETVIKWI